jgi:hypothetical protein
MESAKIDKCKQYTRRAPELYLQTCAELKKEIAESIKEERLLERNAILACGAVYTYILEKTHQFPRVALYVPCAIALFGAYRTIVLMISITPRGRYLKRVEVLMLDDTVLEGWETYFRAHYRFGVGASMWLFWIVLIAVTIVAPQYFPKIDECVTK